MLVYILVNKEKYEGEAIISVFDNLESAQKHRVASKFISENGCSWQQSLVSETWSAQGKGANRDRTLMINSHIVHN